MLQDVRNLFFGFGGIVVICSVEIITLLSIKYCFIILLSDLIDGSFGGLFKTFFGLDYVGKVVVSFKFVEGMFSVGYGEGNLSDFNPEKDAVPYDALESMDKYALHTLQKLIKRTRKAYDTYEFHIIYHALYNYCTLDLSAFYLDILKKDIRNFSFGI